MRITVDAARLRALADELRAARAEQMVTHRRAYPIGTATVYDADALPVEPNWAEVRHLEQLNHRAAEKRAAMERLGASETVPCAVCGKPKRVTDWADVSTYADATPRLLPARLEPCPTPRCGEVCKICRRDIGDVHGPDCGPLMFTKLERPHIVDRSDCT